MKFALFYLNRSNPNQNLQPFATGDDKQPTLWVRMEVVNITVTEDEDEFAVALDLAHENVKPGEIIMNCHLVADPWGPGGKFIQAEEGIKQG